ncbi:HAD family hydrolase [Streptomyces sp. NPDC059639]|uniref:HAD family hydrolase n=1 Tax=Streptomyces sp. NPDC059639 TaxID=3346891 RepID=UPI0036C15AED
MPRTCLIVDFGGVLTTPLDAAVRGFEKRENLAAGAVDRTWYLDPRMVRLTGDLERGRVTQTEWNRRAARTLGVDDGNLIGRIFADLAPDPLMVEAAARARTAGLKVGLLSNSVGLEPWDMYRGCDVDGTFDAALVSGRCGLRKPEPAMYELLLKMLGVSGEECVFVDDNAENLVPAETLGMATVLHRDAQGSVARLEELFGVTLRAPVAQR